MRSLAESGNWISADFFLLISLKREIFGHDSSKTPDLATTRPWKGGGVGDRNDSEASGMGNPGKEPADSLCRDRPSLR